MGSGSTSYHDRERAAIIPTNRNQTNATRTTSACETDNTARSSTNRNRRLCESPTENRKGPRRRSRAEIEEALEAPSGYRNRAKANRCRHRDEISPDDLIGQLVVIVTNLKPTTLMGIESQGMVLAAGDHEVKGLLSVVDPVEPGTKVR